MSGSFRPSLIFDPLLVISQIITMQSLWYTSLGILVYITDCLTGRTPCLLHIFSTTDISIRTSVGVLCITSYLVNSLCGSLYLWYVVKRAKPCLDYASTIHCLHLLFSWMVMGRFPWSLSWWMINGICLTITCVCGEFLCMRTEMKTIPLLSAMEMESKADV